MFIRYFYFISFFFGYLVPGLGFLGLVMSSEVKANPQAELKKTVIYEVLKITSNADRESIRTAIININDLYKILGVSRYSSSEEIRNAYRKLAKQYHPDLNPGREKIVQPIFEKIDGAYKTLGDPEKRRIYDNIDLIFEYLMKENSMEPVQSWDSTRTKTLNPRDDALRYAQSPVEHGGLGLDSKSAQAFANRPEFLKDYLTARKYLTDHQIAFDYAHKEISKAGLGMNAAQALGEADRLSAKYTSGELSLLVSRHRISYEYATRPLAEGGLAKSPNEALSIAQQMARDNYGKDLHSYLKRQDTAFRYFYHELSADGVYWDSTVSLKMAQKFAGENDNGYISILINRHRLAFEFARDTKSGLALPAKDALRVADAITEKATPFFKDMTPEFFSQYKQEYVAHQSQLQLATPNKTNKKIGNVRGCILRFLNTFR